MIRGVGPVYAKKLVRAFGEKVFDVIEATPERLREVDGIGPVRAASILAAWAEQKAVREIMVFLHSHGVGTARAVRIFKTYGADAIQVMTENPYRLARDIRGIGFKTADAIAMKLGIEKTAMIRVRAGISYALTEAMDEGHCGLPTDELVPLAEALLEVPQELIRTAVDLELQEGTVVAERVGETPCVFLAGLHRAERTIAEGLMRLANGPLPWPWIDANKALPWVEQRIGLALAESQVEAIRLALTSKVLVMTGGPGVGKTTIVKAILRILSAKGVRLLLCAPTGRAAKRMTEAAGFEAKTIHRLLEVDPKGGGFKRGDDNPLDSVGGRRGIHGRCYADAGAHEGGAGEGCSLDRWRHRPAAFGRSRPSAGRRHLIRRRASGAPHRGVSAGRAEPHHHQRSSYQPWLDP
jgi:exodeoxyribonuclease V alpha subunit